MVETLVRSQVRRELNKEEELKGRRKESRTLARTSYCQTKESRAERSHHCTWSKGED
jgi:hypothetical protein